MTHQTEEISKLEALLFVHGEPITLGELSSILGMEKEAVSGLIEQYKEKLGDPERGLMLLSHGDKIQLVTKPSVGSVLSAFVKQELDSDLSPASLETLSIIMYLGPISRNKIEFYRGVNSSMILRSLGLRGLISRVSDLEKAGGWLYEPSFNLLKHLNVSKAEDLPEYSLIRTKFENKEAASELEQKIKTEPLSKPIE